MNQFLWGALATSSWVAGLFFLRFWSVSRDRFFLFFFGAFWSFSLNWAWLALANPPQETKHYAFIVRLVAFVLIIVGIVDKNRRER